MVYREQNIEIPGNLSKEEYQREYSRIWRKQNADYIKEYNKLRYGRQLERIRKNKRDYIEYMGSRCEMCGLEFNGENAAVFDFHHRDPREKKHNFGGKCLTLESAKPELDKCVLLCSNCHRMLHSEYIVLEDF